MCAQPCHVGLGSEVEIVCDAFLSLAASDIGKEMAFLDLNAISAKGMFGRVPIPIWKDKDWNVLLGYIVAGMSFNTGGWEDLDFCPQIWTTIDQKRDRAPPGARDNLRALKSMAENPTST